MRTSGTTLLEPDKSVSNWSNDSFCSHTFIRKCDELEAQLAALQQLPIIVSPAGLLDDLGKDNNTSQVASLTAATEILVPTAADSIFGSLPPGIANDAQLTAWADQVVL